MKRSVIILTFLATILSIQAQDFVYDNITYRILDNVAKTCATKKSEQDYGKVKGNDIVIPEVVYHGTEPYTVLSIGYNSFFNSSIRSISIPETVVYINDFAFSNCNSLENVKLPASLSHIGERAFYLCTSLDNVKIPEKVTTIKQETFFGCINLSNITLPKRLKNIERNAFSYCNFTEISLPETTTTINEYAFYNCKKLNSVKLPSKLETLSSGIFAYCQSLENIELPQNLTTIGEQAFCGTLITDIIFPLNLKTIKAYAFAYTELNKINIPSSLTEIDPTAFERCGHPEWINDYPTLPRGSLIDFYVDKDNPAYSSENGVLFDKEKTTLVTYPNGRSDTSYSVPACVTKIGDHAFAMAVNLLDINLPADLSSIGQYAFLNCKNLKEMELPPSLTTISSFAFTQSGLESIILPEKVNTIGHNPFNWCENLTQITVEESNPNFCSIDGVLFEKNMTTLISYPMNKPENKYTIPHNVKKLGVYSMNRNIHISEIIFPETLEDIEDSSLFKSHIYSLRLPDSVNHIGEHSFAYSDNLTEAYTGENTKHIGEYAFADCPNLSKVYIGSNVEIIGMRAFNSENIKEVYYAAEHLKDFDPNHEFNKEFNQCVFSLKAFENATLYLTETGYREADNVYPWSEFKHKEIFDPANIKGIVSESDNNSPVEIYTLQGIKTDNDVNQLPAGIYIVRQGTSKCKIIKRQ